MILKEVPIVKGIMTQLQEREFKDGDKDLDLWKISLALTEKICEYKVTGDDKRVTTGSVITELWKDAAARDEMLKIGRLYHRFSVFTEFASQKSFGDAMKMRTPTLI